MRVDECARPQIYFSSTLDAVVGSRESTPVLCDLIGMICPAGASWPVSTPPPVASTVLLSMILTLYLMQEPFAIEEAIRGP